MVIHRAGAHSPQRPKKTLHHSVIFSFYSRQKFTGLALTLFLVLHHQPVLALPEGYRSVTDGIGFVRTPNSLQVDSTVQKAIVGYHSFNIGEQEQVIFNLPNSQSAILNRVDGGIPSQILGSISSNGQVFITNPSGILFGPNAQINVGALFASTQVIPDDRFLSGQWQFKQDPVSPPGLVRNEGTIHGDHYVVLSGAAIENNGTIQAQNIRLAIGDQISLQVDPALDINLTVDQALSGQMADMSAAINNTGNITGGDIRIKALLADDLYERAINNEGVITARSFNHENGKIVLVAHGGDAVVRNAGTLDASGTTNSPDGGRVRMEGDYVVQAGDVLAEAAPGGEGGRVVLTSVNGTLLTGDAFTSARGHGEASDAGMVKIWSDGNTWFNAGSVIDVQGGNVSGDGGFVEVSAKDSVYFYGQALGNATKGQDGSILIDPTDIFIDQFGGDTVTGGDALTGPDEKFLEDNGNNVSYSPNAGGAFQGFQQVYLQATNNIFINSKFDLKTATGISNANVILEAFGNITLFDSLITHGGVIRLIADTDKNGMGGSIILQNHAVLRSDGAGNFVNGAHIYLTARNVIQENNINIIATGQLGSLFLNGKCVSNCNPMLPSDQPDVNVNTVNATLQFLFDPYVNNPNSPLTVNARNVGINQLVNTLEPIIEDLSNPKLELFSQFLGSTSFKNGIDPTTGKKMLSGFDIYQEANSDLRTYALLDLAQKFANGSPTVNYHLSLILDSNAKVTQLSGLLDNLNGLDYSNMTKAQLIAHLETNAGSNPYSGQLIGYIERLGDQYTGDRLGNIAQNYLRVQIENFNTVTQMDLVALDKAVMEQMNKLSTENLFPDLNNLPASTSSGSYSWTSTTSTPAWIPQSGAAYTALPTYSTSYSSGQTTTSLLSPQSSPTSPFQGSGAFKPGQTNTDYNAIPGFTFY